MRPEKTAMLKEVRGRMEHSGFVILSGYRGLSVQKLADLRRRLRGQQAEIHVARNAFVGLAARELGWDGAATLLDGPTAVVTGRGDVTEVAKILQGFAKDNTQLAVRGGWLGARALSAADVAAMASLPPKAVLLGQFLGTLAAPMTQLVGVLQQKVLSLLYVLKAVEEKKQKAP